MNAPTTAEHLQEITAELVPLDVICPSQTHLQRLRRKRFNEQGLLELAANIKATGGVLQPILLRPFPAALAGTVTPKPKYELVAGERRLLATRRAGYAHIHAVIRELDDGAVLLAQMSENKQRDDYTPIEEAAGYADLRELMKWDAQQIADHIGKSKSYVYARLKLTALGADARAALEAGTLDFSKALLVARLPNEKLQAAAVKKIGEYGGARLAYPRAVEMLRDKFMVNLAEAPFALDDAGYFRFEKVRGYRGRDAEAPIEIPACLACPSNSANDPELERDCGAHMCTDKPCFEIKVVAFWKRKAETAKREGRDVVSADQLDGKLPERGYMGGGFNAQYLDLDAESDQDYPEPEPEAKDDAEEDSPEFQARHNAWMDASEAWRAPSYRQLLGVDCPTGTLVQAGKGELRELITTKDAQRLLKAKGIKITVPGWMRERDDDGAAEPTADRQAEIAREQERHKVEMEWRMRLLREIHVKFKGPLKRPDLERIADTIDCYGDALESLYSEPLNIKTAKESDLLRFIVIAGVASEADDSYRKPGRLLELAQRLKIDAKALRAQVVKDLKPTAAPPAEDDDQPAAKPTKKKAAKK